MRRYNVSTPYDQAHMLWDPIANHLSLLAASQTITAQIPSMTRRKPETTNGFTWLKPSLVHSDIACLSIELHNDLLRFAEEPSC